MESGWGWYKRLKASGILTSPDWIMLCHTAFSSSHHFVSKYGKDSFSGFWSECQGHESMNRTIKWHKIKYDKHDKHDIDPIQGWVTLWSKQVLHRTAWDTLEWDACESWLAVGLSWLSCLFDYPNCQTIGSNCPSDRGLFGADHFSRLQILMLGQWDQWEWLGCQVQSFD